MTDEPRSTGRYVPIGMVISLLAGAATIYILHLAGTDGSGFPWQLMLAFVVTGFSGALWWWRVKSSWSLALILFLDLLAFCIIGMAIVRSALFGAATLFLTPIMFLLMFIGAKLAYWTRDYIEYRWGD